MHDTKYLDRIQDEAARIVTVATKLVSLKLLQNDVCWDLLQERRQKHKLKQIFKMKNNFCPEYLTSLVPFDVGDSRNPYNLRNSNNIQLIHSRTTLYYNSFLPSSIRLWNDLPSDMRNNPSINSFKTYLNRNTLPANPLFFYGDRISHTFNPFRQTSSNP